ncbi:MAG TPA: hypothetical protein VIC62_06640 [Nakamurella sp.]
MLSVGRWTGQEFTAATARTVFWWGLWIATAASVRLWRRGAVVAQRPVRVLRVSGVVGEGPGAVSVHLPGREKGARPEARQFFTLRLPSGRGCVGPGNRAALTGCDDRARLDSR